MKLYGAISKVEPQDDGTIRVYGVASTEAVDSEGEIIRADAMRAAIPDYLRYPALREMHQLSAAGSTLEAEVGDDDATRIVAHVVDPIAIKKVTERVYRGFSIGGKVTARDPANRKIITGLNLTEISLVDRPSCPDAILDCWKADTSGDTALSTQNTAMADALVAAFIAGQEIPKEDVAKANAPGTPVDGKDVAPPTDGDPVEAIKPEKSGEDVVGKPVDGKDADPPAAADGVSVIRPEPSGEATVEKPVDGKRPPAMIPSGDGKEVQVVNPDGETVDIDADLAKADEAGEPDPIVKRNFTAAQRREAAKSGAAMKDGSFPIETKKDLADAIQAIGRAKDRDATIKHIKRRAKALGLEDELPPWMGGKKDEPKKKAEMVHIPGQVWTCGDPSHSHLAKADALRCVDQQDAIAKAAAAAKPAADAVAELREVVGAALASVGKEIAKPEPLRKGLYTLSDLACLLMQMRSMVCNVDYEETAEKDEESRLPQLMRDALKALVAAFVAMTDEETAELMDSVATNTALPDTASTFLYLAAQGDIFKAGARHSKTDMERVQKAHDIMADLGAKCAEPADDADKVAKAMGEKDAEIAELRKVLDQVTPLTKAVSELGVTLGQLRETAAAQASEIEVLKAQPMPPKTAAYAVEKAFDGAPSSDDAGMLATLAAMTEEERALLVAKAALRNPMPVRVATAATA